MGSPVGVYSKKQLEALDPKQRAMLKKRAIQYLQTSSEIRKIISADPTVLTEHRKIRKVLKAKLLPLHNQLKGKKLKGKK